MAVIIAIASGKGGVGKTLITASLAVALQRRGHAVLAVDADMGLRNLDLLFGMQDDVMYDAGDVVKGRCRRSEALLTVTEGLDFLAASQKHTWEKIDAPSYQYLIEELAREYDYVLIDCPPGRGRAFKDAVAVADTMLFVVEPTWSSMRDTARVMQFCNKHRRFHYAVLLNNFYRSDPGFVSVHDMLQVLQPETVAGILPHDSVVHGDAQQGSLVHSRDSAFWEAMTETVSYIEKGIEPDIDLLIELLPLGEGQAVEMAARPSHGDEDEPSMGKMKDLAVAELQRAAAILQGSLPEAEEEAAEEQHDDSNANETAQGDETQKAPTLSLRSRRNQSMAWRHYRR